MYFCTVGSKSFPTVSTQYGSTGTVVLVLYGRTCRFACTRTSLYRTAGGVITLPVDLIQILISTIVLHELKLFKAVSWLHVNESVLL